MYYRCSSSLFSFLEEEGEEEGDGIIRRWRYGENESIGKKIETIEETTHLGMAPRWLQEISVHTTFENEENDDPSSTHVQSTEGPITCFYSQEDGHVA